MSGVTATDNLNNDWHGKSHGAAHNSTLSFRYHKLLRHAFISKNRNTLFLLVDDGLCVGSGDSNDDYTLEINWMGIRSEICRDQLVAVHRTGSSFETKLQLWLLTKLMALEGNFPFYCLPLLCQLSAQTGGGIEQLTAPLTVACTESAASVHYADAISRALAAVNSPLVTAAAAAGITSAYSVPLFLHADAAVDWQLVRRCIYDKFSSPTVFIGHYASRSGPLSQDVNCLLVALLRYFQVSPDEQQLPFTTAQMATLVSDCLRSRSTVPEDRSLVLLIEDIGSIASSSLTNEVCSWLPERCAPNIQVVITAGKESLHEKSLRCRLSPPVFIDVSYRPPTGAGDTAVCTCPQLWCISKLLCSADTFASLAGCSCSDDVNAFVIRIMSIFTCSVICALTRSQINWLLSFDGSADHGGPCESSTDEKDQSELSEKAMMNTSSKHGKVPPSHENSHSISTALHVLVSAGIICVTSVGHSDEHCYSLAVCQLSEHISAYLRDRIDPRHIELTKCRLAAYLVYQCTDLYAEILFVPSLLQYLSAVKDATLKDWLVNWPVLVRLRDEFCVPVKLLSLWRALLGPSTDYKPMINAYLATCLSDKRDPSDCCSCRKAMNVELQHGRVFLGVLRQSPQSDCSKAYSKHRCRVLLDLARISMQVGQYSVAKEMARSLLKQLDQLSLERSSSSSSYSSFCAPMNSNRKLLASCLHLLFCTLDERLKTFEFVTEQTTPIFRRTVHYGARALLLQHDIMGRLQKSIDNISGAADERKDGSRRGDLAKLRQELCQAEIRLAHIMTHFVFSLDGVEQTVINRHFMASEIRSVTHGCMTRAHEIATRLKDRQLLLEIQMTFGVIQPRENFKEKILLYKTPLRQALCIYGEGHIFVSRLYINIGISYEEQKKYIKAFEYFTLWSHVTHELLGRNHCKSLRSCGVFKEPIFKVTADFLKNLNDEEPNESLEEELSDCINNIDVDNFDSQGANISVSGVGIGGSGSNPVGDSMSVENMFMMRNNLEHESDWEIHSSDDETPNYTTAFEEVIEKFKKRPSNTVAKELLQSILNSSLIEWDDFSKEDIDCLIRSQESLSNDMDSSGRSASYGVDSNVTEAFRITRMFRNLRELAQWIPSTNLSPSDISLSRRLLELQRELEEFLDN